CCASLATHHPGIPAVSFAQLLVFPGRFSLSRTVYARAFHHFYPDLDCSRYFHLGSDRALALKSRAKTLRGSSLRDARLIAGSNSIVTIRPDSGCCAVRENPPAWSNENRTPLLCCVEYPRPCRSRSARLP